MDWLEFLCCVYAVADPAEGPGGGGHPLVIFRLGSSLICIGGGRSGSGTGIWYVSCQLTPGPIVGPKMLGDVASVCTQWLQNVRCFVGLQYRSVLGKLSLLLLAITKLYRNQNSPIVLAQGWLSNRFPTLRKQKEAAFFCFSRMRISQIWTFFSLSSFSLCLSFYSQFCCSFCCLSFAQNFGWIFFQEWDKFTLQMQRAVGKQQNCQQIFPQMLLGFCL